MNEKSVYKRAKPLAKKRKRVKSRKQNSLRSKSVAAHRSVTELKSSEGQQKIIKAELDHRVKNTLSVVLSMAQQTLRRANSMESFRETFEGRILALAEVHRLVTESERYGVQLRNLIVLSLKPYIDAGSSRILLDGAQITLGSRAAQTFFVALHELASNAAKYGCLSVPEGRLEIRWSIESDEQGEKLQFAWNEINGPQLTKVIEKGFGTRLIEQIISYELNSDVDIKFKENGLQFHMSAPISIFCHPDNVLMVNEFIH